MGFFDSLEKLTKAVVGIAVTPLDVAADIVTLGGAFTGQEKPYTVQRLEKVKENLDEALD